ncbi:hypothetical protein STEG23_024895, partial [Scotinomys teguina]
QEALPRQQNLLASSTGLGIRCDVIGAVEVVKKDREIMVYQPLPFMDLAVLKQISAETGKGRKEYMTCESLVQSLKSPFDGE